MKMSLVLKKALMVMAGVSMVTAVTAMMSGCNEAEGPVDGVTNSYILDEKNYIVIDGVLHYGDIYTSAIYNSHGYGAYDIQATPVLNLQDGTSVKTYQYKAFKEKPNNTWYKSECDDCLHR